MLLQIRQLRHAGVVGLVVGEPAEQPVAERAEGIGGQIQRCQKCGQHEDRYQKQNHPFF